MWTAWLHKIPYCIKAQIKEKLFHTAVYPIHVRCKQTLSMDNGAVPKHIYYIMTQIKCLFHKPAYLIDTSYAQRIQQRNIKDNSNDKSYC